MAARCFWTDQVYGAMNTKLRTQLKMTPTGLEHPPQIIEKTAIPENGGAKSGALSSKNIPIDPDWQAIIERCPDPETQAAILAMLTTERRG
jgi:hypothetical protein